MTDPPTAPPLVERRLDIDWVRVLAMLAVFCFHCARFFDHQDWHVKNGQLSPGLSVLVSFLSFWIMPIFFVVSGFSAGRSLRSRKPGRFAVERLKRLGVPLLLGIFVLVPPQVYIERVSHLQFTGSFIDFYPLYFDGFYGFGGNFAWMGLHLWYLLLLLILSFLLLPVLIGLGKWERKSSFSRLAGFLARPGAVFLLALPLAAMELLVNLQPYGVGRRDFGGWSLLVYLVFFLLGRLIAADRRFSVALVAHRWSALVLAGVISSLLLTAWHLPGFAAALDSDLRYLLAGTLRPLASWCWLVAILGFAGKHLNRGGRVLRYANQAVLPFYVLHQSVIVVVAFFLIGWNAGVAVKYLALLAISFVSIAAVYEGLIRRLGPLRFLFGMRSKKSVRRVDKV